MTDTLKHARDNIAEGGGSELEALEDQPAAKEMWQQIQDLRAKKYAAVTLAAEEAAKPFDEEIAALEADYALLLRLST